MAKCIGARFELDAAAYFNGVGTTHPSGQAHSPLRRRSVSKLQVKLSIWRSNEKVAGTDFRLRPLVNGPPNSNRRHPMAKDEHNKAAEHHETAAKSHRAAAEQHGKGDHAKGKEHSTNAQQHSQNARQLSEQAHNKSQQQK